MRLVNAFSLNMLSTDARRLGSVAVVESLDVTLDQARERVSGGEWEPVLGHNDLAALLRTTTKRETLTLSHGDSVVVCQLVGPRLPEGATELPEGFSLEFLLVRVENPLCRNCLSKQ